MFVGDVAREYARVGVFDVEDFHYFVVDGYARVGAQELALNRLAVDIPWNFFLRKLI